MAGERFVKGGMAVRFWGSDFEGCGRGWEEEMGFIEELSFSSRIPRHTASAPCLTRTRSLESVIVKVISRKFGAAILEFPNYRITQFSRVPSKPPRILSGQASTAFDPHLCRSLNLSPSYIVSTPTLPTVTNDGWLQGRDLGAREK